MENLDKDTINAATTNFTLPHDILNLPTGGLFYKNKQKTVKIGYLNANDENMIVDGALRNSDVMIQNLIRNKLYEPELKVHELLEQDVEAILIFLRNSSFGPEYNFKLKDPGTSKEFNTTVMLDELNIKEAKYKPNSDGTFDVKLPRSGANVKIRPLTYFEKQEINQFADSYPAERTPPTITMRLNKQIVELDGSNDRNKITQFIENLPIMDSKFIKNFLFENVPSLDLTKQVQTPSGEMVTLNIAFGVEFFRPFF